MTLGAVVQDMVALPRLVVGIAKRERTASEFGMLILYINNNNNQGRNGRIHIRTHLVGLITRAPI